MMKSKNATSHGSQPCCSEFAPSCNEELTPDILGIHHLIKYGDFSDDMAEWLMNQRDEAELECPQ